MKNRFFWAAIFSAAMSVMTGCKQGNALATDGSGFAVSAIERTADADSTLQCKIRVDYPTTDDSLSLAVRHFVCDELAKNYLPVINCPDSVSAYPVFSGATDKGNAVVDFYVNGTISYLKKQAAELLEVGARPSMSYDLSVTMTADTLHYMSYEVKSYAFLGGAHGSATDYTVNIAKPTGKILTQTVDTSQVKAMQPLLRKGVLKYLRDGGSENINEQNLTDYLFINEGIIPLPVNAPYLAADGVHFVYQQYEIGPYAMGMVSFTVPYNEIKPYLTEEVQKLIE